MKKELEPIKIIVTPTLHTSKDNAHIQLCTNVAGALSHRIIKLEELAIKEALISQGWTPPEEDKILKRPLGAIHNGREHIRRLEEHYDFQCDCGKLFGCVDWHELKTEFEAISEFIMLFAGGNYDSKRK